VLHDRKAVLHEVAVMVAQDGIFGKKHPPQFDGPPVELADHAEVQLGDLGEVRNLLGRHYGLDVVELAVVVALDAPEGLHFLVELGAGQGRHHVQAEVVHVLGAEIEEVLPVLLGFVPVADHEGGHDHEFIFFQDLHGAFHGGQGDILVQVVEHVLLGIFHPDHELVDAGLLEARHEVFVAHHEIGPALQPEVLAELSLFHFLDEGLAALPGEVEDVVADVEGVAVVFRAQQFQFLADPFGPAPAPAPFPERGLRTELAAKAAAPGEIDEKGPVAFGGQPDVGMLHIHEVVGRNGQRIEVFDERPFGRDDDRAVFSPVGQARNVRKIRIAIGHVGEKFPGGDFALAHADVVDLRAFLQAAGGIEGRMGPTHEHDGVREHVFHQRGGVVPVVGEIGAAHGQAHHIGLGLAQLAFEIVPGPLVQGAVHEIDVEIVEEIGSQLQTAGTRHPGLEDVPDAMGRVHQEKR